jgi:hypothetical protein
MRPVLHPSRGRAFRGISRSLAVSSRSRSVSAVARGGGSPGRSGIARFCRSGGRNANLIGAVPYRAVLTASPLHGPNNLPRDKHEREREQRMCQNFGHLRPPPVRFGYLNINFQFLRRSLSSRFADANSNPSPG